jgi:phosphoadenosine phosphosulfate reductase
LTLWGERDKVKVAIERLQAHEPQEGYYLAFSGGKDSQCIYHLAEKAGVKFDAHYQITTVDPPELVQFIHKQYPQVERHHPEQSMWALVESNDFPPTRQQRYCCKELKETGGSGRVVVTGVRWAESVRRSKRRMVEPCMNDGRKSYLHPIIDWTDEDVWEFIRVENLPYCRLYDEGFTRLGCVLCPNETHSEKHIERWPRIAAQYVRTFDRVIKHRLAVGKRCTFKTGQELFDWWVQRDKSGANDAQPVLFE